MFLALSVNVPTVADLCDRMPLGFPVSTVCEKFVASFAADVMNCLYLVVSLGRTPGWFKLKFVFLGISCDLQNLV